MIGRRGDIFEAPFKGAVHRFTWGWVQGTVSSWGLLKGFFYIFIYVADTVELMEQRIDPIVIVAGGPIWTDPRHY